MVTNSVPFLPMRDEVYVPSIDYYKVYIPSM